MSGKDTMDRVIRSCYQYDLFRATTEGLGDAIRVRCGSTCVRVGNLAFHANSHSTGCSVNVWVIDGPDALEVRNTTYWYWYSHNYTFNKPHNIYGPWDAAISEAVESMRLSVAEREQKNAEEKAKAQTEKDRAAKEIQGRFGAQFTNPIL